MSALEVKQGKMTIRCGDRAFLNKNKSSDIKKNTGKTPRFEMWESCPYVCNFQYMYLIKIYI